MSKKFLIIGIFIFVFPVAVMAQCRWVPYEKSQCSAVGSSWVAATQDSFCANETKGGNDIACCCGSDSVKVGCCETTTFSGGVGGTSQKHANIVDDTTCPAGPIGAFFSPYPLYYVGTVNSEPGCVKTTNRCFWTLNNDCKDIGFLSVAGADAEEKCKGTYKAAGAKCCCGPQSGYVPTGKSDAAPANPTANPPQIGGSVRSNYKTLPNPLGPTSWTIINLPTIIGKVINALLSIIGAIALIIFVYGGFTWMTAAGNDAKVAQGKNILLWATIAIVIIFLSWMLVAFFFQALGV